MTDTRYAGEYAMVGVGLTGQQEDRYVMTEDRQATCEERISAHLESRADDVARLIAAQRCEHFHAGYNVPGYLPENDGAIVRTFDEAKTFLVHELDRSGDAIFDGGETEDDKAIADEYSAAMEDLNLTGEGDADGSFDVHLPLSTSEHDLGLHFWITRCNNDSSLCEIEDDYNEDSIYEFGLSLERKVALKFLMSTGGPADWLEILCDEERDSTSQYGPSLMVDRVTYHFSDWFDHAELTVTDGPLYEFAEWLVESQGQA